MMFLHIITSMIVLMCIVFRFLTFISLFYLRYLTIYRCLSKRFIIADVGYRTTLYYHEIHNLFIMTI